MMADDCLPNQTLDASVMAVATAEENTLKTDTGEGQGMMWWEMLSFFKGTSRQDAILCPWDIRLEVVLTGRKGELERLVGKGMMW